MKTGITLLIILFFPVQASAWAMQIKMESSCKSAVLFQNMGFCANYFNQKTFPILIYIDDRIIPLTQVLPLPTQGHYKLVSPYLDLLPEDSFIALDYTSHPVFRYETMPDSARLLMGPNACSE